MEPLRQHVFKFQVQCELSPSSFLTSDISSGSAEKMAHVSVHVESWSGPRSIHLTFFDSKCHICQEANSADSEVSSSLGDHYVS